MPEILSLDTATCVEELHAWLELRGNPIAHAEIKSDGVAAIVTYSNGYSVAIRTRKLHAPLAMAVLPHLPGFSGSLKGELWSQRGRPWAADRIRAGDTTACLRWMREPPRPDRRLPRHKGHGNR